MNKKEQMKRITGEWYLYHNIKNENALLPVIILSCITFFFKSGLLISIGIWIWYYFYCEKNNAELDKDPKILKEREWWIESHKKNGDLEECKSILGIR
jgi:hypothetical protein